MRAKMPNGRGDFIPKKASGLVPNKKVRPAQRNGLYIKIVSYDTELSHRFLIILHLLASLFLLKLLKTLHHIWIRANSLYNLMESIRLKIMRFDYLNHLVLGLLVDLHKLGLQLIHGFFFLIAHFNRVSHLWISFAHHNLLETILLHILLIQHRMHILAHFLLQLLGSPTDFTK